MGIITAILKRPSQRTTFEATLAGVSILTITSIITPIYVIFFSDSAIWLKFLTGFGGIALFLLMFSNLSLTYIQYSAFKQAMGMYPTDKKLLIKLEEAKKIKNELESLIKENEDSNLTKLNKGGK
jgi:hypothetical protein